MMQAIGIEAVRVAEPIGDALQSAGFIDDERIAFWREVAEAGGIEIGERGERPLRELLATTFIQISCYAQ